MVQSLIQKIIWIRKNCSRGGNIYLRSSCCQRQQFWYLQNKTIHKSAPQVCPWTCQVLNHVFICLRTLLEALDIEFYVIQRKYVPIEKYMPSFILVVRVWPGEDIPHTIFNHVLAAFILVIFYRGFRLSLYRSSFKLEKYWKLGAYPLCYYCLLESLVMEPTIMNISFPVFGFLVILVSWKNSVIIIPRPSEEIHIGVWVHSLPSKYVSIIFLVQSAA